MEDVPYGRILREGWILILVAAFLGAVAAYGVTVPMPRTYSASSTMILQVESDQASLFERNQFSQARIKSYPPLVDSPEVVDGVRRDLHLKASEYSDRDIRRMLSADNTADTVLLLVTAEAPTAKMSADMANSAAAHTSDLIESTENVPGDTRYTVTMQQVLPASAPSSAVSPQVLPITGLGFIFGLAAGAIIAVYRTATNRHLHTISDVRKASGLPVVGRIPRIPRIRPAGTRAREVQEAAYAETVSNAVALAGSEQRAITLVPASRSSLTESTVTGLAEAYGELGRRLHVIDLRARSDDPSDADVDDAEVADVDDAEVADVDDAEVADVDESSDVDDDDLSEVDDDDLSDADDDLSDVEDGEVATADDDDLSDAEDDELSDAEEDDVSDAEGDEPADAEDEGVHDSVSDAVPSWRADALESAFDEIDALDSRYDIGVVLLDPGMTGALARLAERGVPVLVSVRAGETTVTDLMAVTMRMRVMAIQPLGVLMTGTRSGANDAVAESWRTSDRYAPMSRSDADS